ncbi:hypothetical protein [Candidatus Nitrosacidococcus tergens]|uniref:Uncharacterized protein n=1 Tax=Candidatus Nitrosacidococcus tergens TaxID=553981 RepID=A0A7G1QBN2_9GAMM|nr:hypothetical protein [Candidatus Nitrosacidococcus tergens]CAB1277415.1 conserved exported protein of unknown function [Candidatus Nitrosacidococcus tergens]
MIIKKKSYILPLLSLIFFTHSAFAIQFYPENGWWWNPQQSGSGYNIEVQNDTLFIATFVYDNQGQPTWFSGSANNLSSSDSTVVVALQKSEGGACLGCTYTAPQTGDAGIPLTLSFTDEGHGTVVINGQSTPIERFDFAYGDGLAILQGSWVVSAPFTSSTTTAAASDFGYTDILAYTQVNSSGQASGQGLAGQTIAAQGSSNNSFISRTQASAQQDLVASFMLIGLNTIFGTAALVDSTASDSEISTALTNAVNNNAIFIGYRATPILGLPSSSQQPTSVKVQSINESTNSSIKNFPKATDLIDSIKLETTGIEIPSFK